ncbi:IclR family transcriptional regulator [Pseudorhizobium flavum]|uniref:IclR family mhp operon transcriptional activator n=1 Tax=Pseudorhizobium flavum TaxID=1335061 RepID=A0A7X0DEL8_9HYPH|nr:IclR family transcriptional regulator C-terminal domain-containing protein [Pseudorhizobium flavum]MBB6181940.1 IclR family mhp operon transcriptional activator [Pseudorhizobium flavum]CAD6628720.1 IclR family transcriptional regulator [Pseudorhizobium flavum]
MAAFRPVRALQRGLDVLRLLNEESPRTATTLARDTKLPQPTVVRILETLIASGYVYKNKDTSEFAVTARVLSLSQGYDAGSRLVQLAQPLIEQLRSAIGWPSNLAVYLDSEAAMSIAYTNRSAMGLSVPGRLGARLPLLVTGVGRVLLASVTEEKRAQIFGQLKKSKSLWDTDPQFWQGLDEILAETRSRGYAFADQSYLDDIYDSRIWAVAVPITVKGEVTAAISTLILQGTGPRDKIVGRVLPRLRKTADEIGRQLGKEQP